LAQPREDDAQVGERVGAVGDGAQAGLVSLARALKVALLLQLDPAREVRLRLPHGGAVLGGCERQHES
jgi:hypothetical protein